MAELSKNIFRSKRFWLNTAASILAIILLIDPETLEAFGIPKQYENRILKILGFIVAVINILLLRYSKNTVSFTTKWDDKKQE